MMEERGIDTSRVIIAEPDTIQKFKTHALKLLDAYDMKDEKTRPPMMFVLDSLGMLSTSKEMEDSLEGKDTRDMTKAQIIKAAFRVLTLKLAKVKVPMLVTNHVYELVGSYVPTKGSSTQLARLLCSPSAKKRTEQKSSETSSRSKCTSRDSQKSTAKQKCYLLMPKGSIGTMGSWS
jgi:hypothetical protein